MKQLPRILQTLAALSLLALFVFPLWQIILIAPQYPDGVKMYIHIDKIGGESAGTLQNVNILNHYVGMKPIEPDAIPELQYFKYVILGLVALGLGAALVNRRWAFLSWTLLLVGLSALGLYDFYLWEYDYGHNLSPQAPIEIPGASFQPPLLGTKIILNFVAKSYPHIGGAFAGLAVLLGVCAWWLKGRLDGSRLAENTKRAKKPGAGSSPNLGIRRRIESSTLFFLLTTTLFYGCGAEPQPIAYGEDQCSYCSMTIVDRQHAAEAVTLKGRVYKFDAIECLVGYVEAEGGDSAFAHLLVTDYADPGELVDAPTSTYLISPNIPSPMGAYLSAFADETAAQHVQRAKGGDLYDWEGVKERLRKREAMNEE
jgi:copper chaperone NosL